MVVFLGIVRPAHNSLWHVSRSTRRFCLSGNSRGGSILISRNGYSPFRHILRASLNSSSVSSSTLVERPEEQSEIIFLGTGTSEGIPRVSCLTNPVKTCPVCSKALEPGSKNRRLNTSILIRHPGPSGNSNILIDAGKFFYHSALRWFPAYGIRTIDAVIITHSHADAIGGLDDLRDWTNNVQPSVPIYVAERDFEVMKKTHYYLVDTSSVTPGAAVSELQFNIIKEDPFVVHDIKIIPLPVWHGAGYRSLGFRFGNICYISDVSEIPDETYPLLEDCELLILDALRPDRSSSTHFGLPRALEEVRKIRPRRTLFTGMMHLMDKKGQPGAQWRPRMARVRGRVPPQGCNVGKPYPAFFARGCFQDLNPCTLTVTQQHLNRCAKAPLHLMDHEKINNGLLKLKETEGLDVQLSYDGMRVPVRLYSFSQA